MKRLEIWVNKTHSFKEADSFDINYYKRMTPWERLEEMQVLREQFFKIKKINANRKRLQRTVRIIQQA